MYTLSESQKEKSIYRPRTSFSETAILRRYLNGTFDRCDKHTARQELSKLAPAF